MSLPHQVLDLSQAEGHLSKERGFLIFTPLEGQERRIPLDGILALLMTSRHVTISANLLCALAERQALVIVCGSNLMPLAIMSPLVGNHDLTHRAAAQVALTDRARGKLWQALVRAKINSQRAALSPIAPDLMARFTQLARQVKNGDPQNVEAQAAQIYWPALMGKAFRRRPTAGDGNVHLNYGYAIVRACMARAVVAAGLLPALGLHHSNARNPFVLVDDLMEPYRPLVDRAVFALGREPGPLDAAAKARLVALTNNQVCQGRGMVSLIQGCHDLATSLALVLLGERQDLDLPILSELSFASQDQT